MTFYDRATLSDKTNELIVIQRTFQIDHPSRNVQNICPKFLFVFLKQ